MARICWSTHPGFESSPPVEPMVALRKLIVGRGSTQAQAAEELGVTRLRVSDRLRGKYERFDLDMPVTLAARAWRTEKLRRAF